MHNMSECFSFFFFYHNLSVNVKSLNDLWNSKELLGMWLKRRQTESCIRVHSVDLVSGADSLWSVKSFKTEWHWKQTPTLQITPQNLIFNHVSIRRTNRSVHVCVCLCTKCPQIPSHTQVLQITTISVSLLGFLGWVVHTYKCTPLISDMSTDGCCKEDEKVCLSLTDCWTTCDFKLGSFYCPQFFSTFCFNPNFMNQSLQIQSGWTTFCIWRDTKESCCWQTQSVHSKHSELRKTLPVSVK